MVGASAIRPGSVVRGSVVRGSVAFGSVGAMVTTAVEQRQLELPAERLESKVFVRDDAFRHGAFPHAIDLRVSIGSCLDRQK